MLSLQYKYLSVLFALFILLALGFDKFNPGVKSGEDSERIEYSRLSYTLNQYQENVSPPPTLYIERPKVKDFGCLKRCATLVNHDRKLIIVKHAKTGGTTLVRDLLEPQLCGIFEEHKKKRRLTCERAGKLDHARQSEPDAV